MNKEQLSKYTVRTTQANKSELVVVVYDIILDEMTNAKMSFEQGDMEGFMYSVRHGQKFVLELMNTLDVKYDISKELMRLYIFINREMINSMIRKDVSLLDGVVMVVEKLKVAFEGVAKEDKSGPVMRNVEQVYAGLTYGKGTLNETAINNQGRGFMA